MAKHRIVGLWVEDDSQYSLYRDGMTPILKTYGGGFRYDFRVSEVLKSESGSPINRVFCLSFPTKENEKAFFSNPDYLKVRETFFKPSVKAITIIADFED